MVDSLLDKYDIYYTDSSGNKMGFMLAPHKNGGKYWVRSEDSALPTSYATEDVSYSILSPDVQKTLAHRYFYGGLGALEFEIEDDEDFQKLRYLKTQNIDCRCKGKVYPGPKTSLITIPTSSDRGTAPKFEIFNGYLYFASGKNLYRITLASVPYTVTLVKAFLFEIKDIKTFGDYLYICFGENISLSFTNMNMELTTGWTNGARSSVWYYIGSYSWGIPHEQTTTQDFASWSTDLRGNSVTFTCWVKAGVVGTIRIGLYDGTAYTYSSYNTTTSAQQLTVTATLASTATRLQLQIENSSTGMTNYADYASVSIVPKYAYMSTDEVFTFSTLTYAYGDMFCGVGGTFYILHLPNKICSATDPTNSGTWSSEVSCGRSEYNVNDMKDFNGVLHALKEDGPYYLSSGAFYAAFPWLGTINYEDSGKNSIVFNDGLYFSMSNLKELEDKSDILTEITPQLFSSGIEDYTYPCVAKASDANWLYVIMKRGDNDLILLAGRWETVLSSTRWIWHEIRNITELTDVSTAFVCSLAGRPYLYLASTEIDEDVLEVYLPLTNDATSDGGYYFCESGSLWTPTYRTQLFAALKRWQQITARTLNLTDTCKITVSYSIDDSISWTELGDFTTSPEDTLSLLGEESTLMNLKLDFVGDSESTPPVLKYLLLKGLTIYESKVIFNHTIRCADDLFLKNGMKSPQNYRFQDIYDFVDGIRDTVCTLCDPQGNEHTVRVRVSEETMVFSEKDRKPELYISIQALKTLS